ncbi:hypothetical protein HK405_006020 [Cladochytrium tenue]|nr:hypothetical protein HK405_006020 [Cladochytrium tenue]
MRLPSTNATTAAMIASLVLAVLTVGVYVQAIDIAVDATTNRNLACWAYHAAVAIAAGAEEEWTFNSNANGRAAACPGEH